MKCALAFLLLCLTSHLDAQRDTTVLISKPEWGWTVYIDRTPQEVSYDRLVNFKLDTSRFDGEAIQHQRQIDSFLAEAPLKKWNLHGLPSQWIPLHLYKGEYMVYGFGDYGYNGKIKISDSVISYYGSMHIVHRIDSVIRKKDGSYLLITSPGRYPFDPPNDTLIIRIVDPAKGIAVFSNGESSHPYLMVEASKARQYPIIVNYTIRMKPPEFWDFDEPDFKKMLNDKK